MAALDGTGAFGQGLQVFGLAGTAASAYLGYEAGKGIYQAQSNIAGMQQQLNTLGMHQMELTARRSSLQEVRNAQQARSLALTNTSESGAQFGSALGGAYGNISGTANNNLLGINQNLAIGRQENTLNNSIISQQLAVSKYQGQSTTASGLSSASSGLSSLGNSWLTAATNPSGTTYTSGA